MLPLIRIGPNGHREVNVTNTIKIVSRWKTNIQWSDEMSGEAIIYICSYCEAPFIEGQKYTLRDGHSFHHNCYREWYRTVSAVQSPAILRARRRLDFSLE